MGFQQRPRRKVGAQNPVGRAEAVNIAFKEPVHKILEKIKHEPYFRWLSKMNGDSAKRNQNLYYTYHQEKGHTIVQCKMFNDYFGIVGLSGAFKEYVFGQRGSAIGQVLGS